MDRDAAPRRGAFLRTILLATMLAGGSWGCGPASQAARDPFRGDAGMQRLRISVTNLNWNDATLYTFRGNERRRLGTVSGKGDAEYVIDWPTPSTLRIEIRLMAGRSCVTREMHVQPGEQVSLQIASDLSLDPDCRRRLPS